MFRYIDPFTLVDGRNGWHCSTQLYPRNSYRPLQIGDNYGGLSAYDVNL